MRKISIKHVVMLCSVLVVILLTACGSKKPKDLLVGRWVSDENEIVEFQDDGSCTAPFTYDGAWWESAERYTVKDDGTLVLSSTEGHVDDSFRLVESEDDAFDYTTNYFVSKDTLIIDGTEYSRTE